MTTDVTWFRKSDLKFDGSDYHRFGQQFDRGNPKRVMSRSELVQFGKNPHRWLLGYRDGDSDSTEWGSLVDTVVLTPERVNLVYSVAPETYPAKGEKKGDPEVDKPWNWNATYCKQWRAEQEKHGAKVIKSDELSDAWKAESVLRKTPELAELIASSQKQVVVVVDYVDEQTGLVVPVKCALDIVPPTDSKWGDTLFDLKTTGCASPRAWTRHVYDFGLHIQGALYMDAYNTVEGTDYRQFGHIVQESFEPYETFKRLLSEDFIRIGRAQYRRLLADYCYCLKHNWWPNEDEYQASNGSIRQIDGWTLTEPEPRMELTA